MSAFEELGVSPELIRAVSEMGWELPTPIQAEAVPLILGGGDVMAAAETGSGKTGAFALPVIQIVHEALALKFANAPTNTNSTTIDSDIQPCAWNIKDRDAILAIAPDGVTCQARSETSWGGARATLGAFSGRVYFEATVRDEGLCRIGWATLTSTLDIGIDKNSYGYGGTGKKSHSKQFADYGEPYGLGDTIGCLLDLEGSTISYTKNGTDLGTAFEVDKRLQGQVLFPAVALKNAELQMNFGATPFKYPPPDGFTGLVSAPKTCIASFEKVTAAGLGGATDRKPLAIILEPARDLAEQTHTNMSLFAKYLTAPEVKDVLIVGGMAPNQQLRALNEGIDIIVGTPGRIMDFIEQGKLSVGAIKFFVLDEADRLLDTGNQEAILKMFRRFPKGGTGLTRLQVLMFSATLHSPQVVALAKEICQNPTIVDLKGKEAVPDTVDHVLVKIDPQEDRSWLQSEPQVYTDGVHAFDTTLEPAGTSQEHWSEALKRLKPRMLQRIIDSFNMEQVLVFCRTNFDCDNLEKYLNQQSGAGDGGGKRLKLANEESGVQNKYSCVVLAGQRSNDERRAALKAFKEGSVRILICTDVAARGIDIQGLPYVINMTLPDKSEDYVHRVGRVGRADTMGLAISLVSTVPEKVWYCTVKNLKPWLLPDKQNTQTTEKGGHTIWYDECQLLKEVEERLHQTIPSLSADLDLPPEVEAKLKGVASASAGASVYGQQKGGNMFAKEVQERVEALRPAVQALASIEHEVQSSYFAIKSKWGGY